MDLFIRISEILRARKTAYGDTCGIPRRHFVSLFYLSRSIGDFTLP